MSRRDTDGRSKHREPSGKAKPTPAGAGDAASPPVKDPRSKRNFTWLVALLTAPLFALSFPDASIAPLIYIALVPFLAVVLGLRRPRRFWLGVLVGGLSWGLGYYSVGHLLTIMSDVPPALAWPLFSLVCAYHGLQWGVFAMLAGWLHRLAPRWAWLTVATAWTALEIVFPVLFPWVPGSATAGLGPMGSALDVFGVHGMSFLIVASGVLLVELGRRIRTDRASPWKPAGALAVGALVLLGYGLWREPAVMEAHEAGAPLRFALVQPNFTAAERKSADGETMSAIGRRVLAQLRSLPAGELDLVLLGEGSFPFPFIERPAPTRGDVELPTDRFAAAFREQARRLGAHLVFGTPRFDSTAPDAPARNSLVHLLPSGATARIYDKVRLVPFGERMPLSFLRSLFPRFDDLTPGEGRTPLEIHGLRLGPTICYELMFAGDGRAAIGAGANGLLNATNDVWLGVDTNAAALHLSMQRPRAIENRVTLLRAANTGISAIVLPTGAIPVRSGSGAPEIVQGTVKVAVVGSVYGTLGEWWFILPALATAWLAALGVRRRKVA